MAKALIGYLNSDLRTPPRLTSDNARLRARVADLEALVLRLQEDNDTLAADVAKLEARSLDEHLSRMQPA